MNYRSGLNAAPVCPSGLDPIPMCAFAVHQRHQDLRLVKLRLRHVKEGGLGRRDPGPAQMRPHSRSVSIMKSAIV